MIGSSDTRNTNEMPTWYESNVLSGLYSEFKSTSNIGNPISSLNNFCHLFTVVPWPNPSGGNPVQIAIGGLNYTPRIGIRASADDGSAWGSWYAYLPSIIASSTPTCPSTWYNTGTRV